MYIDGWLQRRDKGLRRSYGKAVQARNWVFPNNILRTIDVDYPEDSSVGSHVRIIRRVRADLFHNGFSRLSLFVPLKSSDRVVKTFGSVECKTKQMRRGVDVQQPENGVTILRRAPVIEYR